VCVCVFVSVRVFVCVCVCLCVCLRACIYIFTDIHIRIIRIGAIHMCIIRIGATRMPDVSAAGSGGNEAHSLCVCVHVCVCVCMCVCLCVRVRLRAYVYIFTHIHIRIGAMPVPDCGSVRQVVAGMKHTLFLDSEGFLYAGGHNTFGQLGFPGLSVCIYEYTYGMCVHLRK